MNYVKRNDVIMQKMFCPPVIFIYYCITLTIYTYHTYTRNILLISHRNWYTHITI